MMLSDHPPPPAAGSPHSGSPAGLHERGRAPARPDPQRQSEAMSDSVICTANSVSYN